MIPTDLRTMGRALLTVGAVLSVADVLLGVGLVAVGLILVAASFWADRDRGAGGSREGRP